MPEYEYQRFDGTQPFQPQSADELFDQFSEYLLEYGDQVLENLEDLAEEHPDLIDKLIQRGLVERDEDGRFSVTPRGIRRVQNRALESLFHLTQKDRAGSRETEFRGAGQTKHEDSRPWQFGDPASSLNTSETLRNALQRQGGGVPVQITHDDLVVHDTEYQTTCATVVLLDMSGSMARYGKFGQAKSVALALGSLVRAKYPGDFLQTVGFYTYATPLSERQLLYAAPKPVSLFDSRVNLRIPLDRPPGFVPEHFTNIHAGLQFARRILKKQPAQNRQIIVITDGEPTAHVDGREIVLIYPPSPRTARATLAEAKRCSAEGIAVASFALIEDYFYHGLVNFVEQMAQVTGGISATCNAGDMGNMVLNSFVNGRRTRRQL